MNSSAIRTKKKQLVFSFSDPAGIMMKLLTAAIIAYSEALQFFYPVNNALLMLGMPLFFIFFYELFDPSKKAIRREANRPSKAVFLTGAYVFFTFALGFVVAPERSGHLSKGISVVEYYLVMAIICHIIGSRKSLSFYLKTYAILGTASCIKFLLDPKQYSDQGEIRYSLAEHLNCNTFAMMLALSIWSLLFLVSAKKIKPIFAFPAIAAMFYSIVMTGSRKGIIGAALCLALWLLLCYFKPTKRISLKTILKILAICIAAFVLIVWIFPWFANSFLFQRFNNMEEEGSFANRMKMYKVGLEYIARSPILGWGYWGFAHFYGVYSHTTIIEVPVSGGVPLALVYFYSYFVIAKVLWKRRKSGLLNLTDDEEEAILMHRMITILFTMMLFYSLVIIHIYELSSFAAFGCIIAGCSDKKQFSNRPGVVVSSAGQ